MTEAGTVTPLAPPADRPTAIPPVAAAALSVTVQVEDWPAVRLVGEQARLDSCAEVICVAPLIVKYAVLL